jgi:membrane associated rhomboid family serine protease
MLIPYGDNLTAGRFFPAVLLLMGLILALDMPAFLSESTKVWQLQYLAFFPVLFSLAPWSNLHTLVSSVFLHGDIVHLLGNCLFLWVFGRSLERLFGRSLFLVAFPFLGAVGLLVHWGLYPASQVPVIGASGAIATLMGAYLALFPSARTRMLLFVGLPIRFSLPAWTFLFYWCGLQLISLAISPESADGVAYAVHAGGFVTGVMGAIIWKVSYPLADERLQQFVRTSFAVRTS